MSVQLLMVLLLLPVPESPAWLVQQGHYTRAEAANRWLRREEGDLASELENHINMKLARPRREGTEREEGKMERAREALDFVSKVEWLLNLEQEHFIFCCRG